MSGSERMGGPPAHLHSVAGTPAGSPVEVRQALEDALFEVKRVIVGQEAMLERLLVALLAGGHVLLEGVPGLAKTLTVKTLAETLGGSFNRIQFTPDLVPSDLVGTRVLNPAGTGASRFDVELGPVFANLLLADEVNRAPAKVQSALLEVMQEKQVTIGHETHRVPSPFLVLATQNPIESEGTYPLPEAQVDRFLFKLVVGYPTERRRSRSSRGCARRTCRASSASSRRSTSTVRSSTTRSRSSARRAGRRTSCARTSSTARARAARSTSCSPRGRSRSCAGARTRCRSTCATSRATSCATGSS